VAGLGLAFGWRCLWRFLSFTICGVDCVADASASTCHTVAMGFLRTRPCYGTHSGLHGCLWGTAISHLTHMILSPLSTVSKASVMETAVTPFRNLNPNLVGRVPGCLAIQNEVPRVDLRNGPSSFHDRASIPSFFCPAVPVTARAIQQVLLGPYG
jgi:hypothetical protein